MTIFTPLWYIIYRLLSEQLWHAHLVFFPVAFKSILQNDD